LTCLAASPNAVLVVSGPGTITPTTSLSTGVGAATTYASATSTIGSGYNAEINIGAQLSQSAFLQSGGTEYELSFSLAASRPGDDLFVSCSVVGSAVPVS
jgi:hypothetical protein